MRAKQIAPLALDSYQRAVRTALSHHLITRTYPDRIALPLMRRWATELREDMLEVFGYRLEVTETTARLFPVLDRLDAGAPARTATDRVFDRRRYTLLALALAALGRAGDQITVSELADHVAASIHVTGLSLDTERAADRDAFVDAVGWLATRSAITLADGDVGSWATNPDAGEALYDIDRSVVLAIFRPPRAVQHLHSVLGLLSGRDAVALDGDGDGDEDEDRPIDPHETARRVRRMLAEQPVVYVDELSTDAQALLKSGGVVADVEMLTGLVAERRAEGVALIDTSGRLSDIRFPSTGTVAQVALLLAGELADLVLDPDAGATPSFPVTWDPTTELASQLDSAIPADSLRDGPQFHVPSSVSGSELHRFVADSWVHDTVGHLIDTYGRTFAAQWSADRDGLRVAAVTMLERLRLLHRVDGGVLALPALARYRGVVVTVRERASETISFTDTDELPGQS